MSVLVRPEPGSHRDAYEFRGRLSARSDERARLSFIVKPRLLRKENEPLVGLAGWIAVPVAVNTVQQPAGDSEPELFSGTDHGLPFQHFSLSYVISGSAFRAKQKPEPQSPKIAIIVAT